MSFVKENDYMQREGEWVNHVVNETGIKSFELTGHKTPQRLCSVFHIHPFFSFLLSFCFCFGELQRSSSVVSKELISILP